MEATATLAGPTSDTAVCRRLAELLSLDAVGVVRAGNGRRRVAWWATPGTDVAPLARILEGSASGWIAFPRGDDLVFAHLTEGSSTRSVATLSAMLGSLTGDPETEPELELGGVAPDDPIERERARLAYAIHDGLTQVVTAAVLDLEWHARRTDAEPGEAVAAMNAAAIELRKALQEIRGVLAGLSPHGNGSVPPIDELIRSVLERWQLPATWSVEGDTDAVPGPVLEVVSSVIRESVANAAKHAGSSDMAISVRVTPSAVEVRVEDGGRGFRPQVTGLHAGHLGLEMMRRRVAQRGGTFDIRSSPGMGTRVEARVPIPEQGV